MNRTIELSTRIVAIVVTVVVGALAAVGLLATTLVTTLSVRNVADTKRRMFCGLIHLWRITTWT